MPSRRDDQADRQARLDELMEEFRVKTEANVDDAARAAGDARRALKTAKAAVDRARVTRTERKTRRS